MCITLVNRVATSHAGFVIKLPAARDDDVVMLAPRAERRTPATPVATDSVCLAGVFVLIPTRLDASCLNQVSAKG